VKRLSQAEQAERRRLGLCYNCDERYTRGHNRVCRRIFFIDGIELADADHADQDPEAPVFSVRAVTGSLGADTMQVKAALGPATLVALLDTGSTHSFISEEAARRSGMFIDQRSRLTATVANGERVPCVGLIRDAPLTIDGATFPADLFVMPLASYDVVLGTRWLGALGPFFIDLASRRMWFRHQNRTVCWTGVPSERPRAFQATIVPDSRLGALLAAFADLFAEPSGLPPKRSHDHRIILKPNTAPVAVRPYRYPAAHKDELERQCAAMIAQGIVRRSDSPFSSPVLLVKKPDGAWRFGVPSGTHAAGRRPQDRLPHS
jgi:hypothetical protein